MAEVITSSTFEGRILGLSKDVVVPTNVLFVFTGNTISVGSDLTRRVIKIDLLAKDFHPEQRRYVNADPVKTIQKARPELLRALLTIQLAWFASGAKEEGPSYGLSAEFDRLVTWPLAFAGETGLFEKKAELEEQSPDEVAKLSLLLALREVFTDSEFTAADVIRKTGTEYPPPEGTPELKLREAVEQGDRRRVFNTRALGNFLSILVDQPPREGLVLNRRLLHGFTKYCITCRKGGIHE